MLKLPEMTKSPLLLFFYNIFTEVMRSSQITFTSSQYSWLKNTNYLSSNTEVTFHAFCALSHDTC